MQKVSMSFSLLCGVWSIVALLLGPVPCESRGLRMDSEVAVNIWTAGMFGDVGLDVAGSWSPVPVGDVDSVIPRAVSTIGSMLLSTPDEQASGSSMVSSERLPNDVFPPSAKISELLAGSTKADWSMLLIAVIVLILFDLFFLSRFTDESKLPEETRKMLRSVFDACDYAGSGYASKRDLVSALARCEDRSGVGGVLVRPEMEEAVDAKMAAISGKATQGTEEEGGYSAHLRQLGSQQVSWEDFEALYAGSVHLSGSNSRTKGIGSIRAHAGVLVVWICVAALYNGMVFIQKGTDAGMQWCTGYVLEWLLSMDNLFVFHLIFQAYSTPGPLLQKALFIGIMGAVVLRMAFFAVVSELMDMFHWVRIVFALLLIYSGVQAAREEDDGDDGVADNFVVRLFRQVFGTRIQSEYNMEGRMFVQTSGRWEMTLLVPVVVCLMITDVLFALDSVSAKVAQIPNFYIAYSSSVLALFGMRSMFFIIQNLVEIFELLKYGLCFILVFIGMELLIAPFVKLPASAVLVVIVAVFTVCIAGSAANQTNQGEDQEGKDEPLAKGKATKGEQVAGSVG